MALTLGDRPIHPLTADDVLRMVDAGIIGDEDRIELLDGVLTEVSPKGAAHETVKQRLLEWLTAGSTPATYVVRIESPLRVRDPLSLPEPDVMALEPRDYTARLPDTALLVVEVADTSVRTDTRLKPRLYAAGGVPEYWVVDVTSLRVECFTDLADGAYVMRSPHRAPKRLAPSGLDVAPLDLTALFAGL